MLELVVVGARSDRKTIIAIVLTNVGVVADAEVQTVMWISLNSRQARLPRAEVAPECRETLIRGPEAILNHVSIAAPNSNIVI